VKPLSFKNLEYTPSNRKIVITYEVGTDVLVHQQIDFLKVEFCKVLGSMECKEKMFPLQSGTNSVEIVDDSVIGKWIIALYHVNIFEISLASNKTMIEKRKLNNLAFIKQFSKFMS